MIGNTAYFHTGMKIQDSSHGTVTIVLLSVVTYRFGN